MTKLVLRAAAAAVLISLGVSSLAQGLEPKKASSLVTLKYFSTTPCPYFVGGLVLDRRWLPDATYVQPFAIPPGKVLIVTEAQMSLALQPPNTSELVQLLLVDPSNGNASPIINRDVAINAAGNWSENITLSPGVAVKSGMVLCEPSGLMTDIVVHGYLAADR